MQGNIDIGIIHRHGCSYRCVSVCVCVCVPVPMYVCLCIACMCVHIASWLGYWLNVHASKTLRDLASYLNQCVTVYLVCDPLITARAM